MPTVTPVSVPTVTPMPISTSRSSRARRLQTTQRRYTRRQISESGCCTRLKETPPARCVSKRSANRSSRRQPCLMSRRLRRQRRAGRMALSTRHLRRAHLSMVTHRLASDPTQRGQLRACRGGMSALAEPTLTPAPTPEPTPAQAPTSTSTPEPTPTPTQAPTPTPQRPTNHVARSPSSPSSSCFSQRQSAWSRSPVAITGRTSQTPLELATRRRERTAATPPTMGESPQTARHKPRAMMRQRRPRPVRRRHRITRTSSGRTPQAASADRQRSPPRQNGQQRHDRPVSGRHFRSFRYS